MSDKFIILDGAMGTVLQEKGIEWGESLEALSITDTKLIVDIHKEYIQNGANVIYSNTFGANEYKLSNCPFSVEEIIDASVKAAKCACENTEAVVALDIGPIGQLLEPAGSLSFEKAYDIFARQIKQGVKSGVDIIVFETMTDLYEVKAGVLAAKENCNLPIFVTMTFEENKRTFTGCSIESMAVTLEGLGVDAIGMNCSIGPKELYYLMEELSRYTTLPMIAKPNAGLPNPINNGYDITADDFCVYMEKIVELGVAIMGGCCGTTPQYINKLSNMLKQKKVYKNCRYTPQSIICSATNAVIADEIKIIGERINPTGKKLFKQALIENDMDYILQQAISQVEAGASVLDVNVGLPGINETEMMKNVVKSLQSVVSVPLQIDSSNAETIEAALRIYNGKAIVNSVNGNNEVLDEILPIVKKYGCAVVGLTLDQDGIPETAEARFFIAQKILNAALAYGIKKEDVYIDCLTLTVSAQQKEAASTLKALHMVKERLGLKTVLGVSNISFGLPNRELINHSFLTLAMAHGLDFPIINPNIESMVDAVYAFNVLYSNDENAKKFVSRFANKQQELPQNYTTVDINFAIEKGLTEEARNCAIKLLKKSSPIDIVNDFLIPALDNVGRNFESGEIFLPQLIQAANAAGGAFDVIKKHLSHAGKMNINKGTIIVATVKGDVHDIGKNIVKVVLENYGYRVIDLGKDVSPQLVVDTVIAENVKLVGLSALMTTTVKSMEETIFSLHNSNADCMIFVGGAVLTEDYAKKIGADFYAKDAKAAVDIAKQIL